MTDDNSMFNQETATPAEPVQQVTPDQAVKTPQAPDMNAVFADKLQAITNEAGEPKYSDVMTALEALKHTQDHVKTLETENRQFRDEDTKARSIDEVLEQITAKQNQSEPTANTGLDAASVKGVTLDTLREYEAMKLSETNQTKVVDALVSKFGDKAKAEELYNAKALELGLTADSLNDLAAASPTAVLSYFNIKDTKATIKTIEGSVNTDALQAQPNEPIARKNIMYGASTHEIVSAWKAAGQAVQNELEIS